MDHVDSTHTNWFYTQLGIQAGPVTADQLAAMARSGQLLRADLVWKEGMANWVEAGTARGLFPTATHVPPHIAPALDAEPPRAATPAGAAPVGDAIWYYEKEGARVGPVSEAEMATLLLSKTLTPTSQIWKKGLTGWTKLGDTELRTKISASEEPPALAGVSEEPPALAGEHVNNTLVWIVALLPIIGLLVEFGVGLHYRVSQTGILIATWAAYIVLCVLDGILVRKAGHDTFGYMFWAVILVPVYLYKRAKKLHQSKGYFFCWLIAAPLSVVFEAALPTTRLSLWSTETLIKPKPVTAAPQAASMPMPSVALPTSAPPATSNVVAAASDSSTPKDAVFATVQNMVAASVLSNWQAVDKLHAGLYQLAAPQRGDQAASKNENREGLAALTANDVANATQAFAKSLALDPANVEARNNLAYAHMLAGHYEEAKRGLIETLGIAPDRASAWANLSDLLAQQGLRDASLACLRLTVRYSKDRTKILGYLRKAAGDNDKLMLQQVAIEVLQEFDAIPSYVPQ